MSDAWYIKQIACQARVVSAKTVLKRGGKTTIKDAVLMAVKVKCVAAIPLEK